MFRSISFFYFLSCTLTHVHNYTHTNTYTPAHPRTHHLHTPPNVERGKAVLLEDLQLQGLKDESAKDEKGRQFNCPHCGAPVQVQLSTSKSITCGSCASTMSGYEKRAKAKLPRISFISESKSKTPLADQAPRAARLRSFEDMTRD